MELNEKIYFSPRKNHNNVIPLTKMTYYFFKILQGQNIKYSERTKNWEFAQMSLDCTKDMTHLCKVSIHQMQLL